MRRSKRKSLNSNEDYGLTATSNCSLFRSIFRIKVLKHAITEISSSVKWKIPYKQIPILPQKRVSRAQNFGDFRKQLQGYIISHNKISKEKLQEISLILTPLMKTQ